MSEEPENAPIMNVIKTWEIVLRTHAISSDVSDLMRDALDAALHKEQADHIMLRYLEAHAGELVGKASSKAPTKEAGEALVDNVLDGAQTPIFVQMRKLYSDEPATEVEILLRQSCNRWRDHALSALRR